MSEIQLRRRSSTPLTKPTVQRRSSIGSQRSTGKSQRAVYRRWTDPQQVVAVWSAIRHVRMGRQVPNLDRVTRYLAREHEIDKPNARKLLRRLSSEKLVIVYKSVSHKRSHAGTEQDGYRLPSAEEKEEEQVKNTHDWYCFECHQGGEVFKCRKCWRVYHPSCCSTSNTQIFICPTCLLSCTVNLNFSRDELRTFLEFALVRMKEKAQPLLNLGNNDEDEDNLLKRQYLLYRLCDLETIENKVKECAYETLEEFREDAATVKHNANIWFGGESAEAELARVMLADCDYELDQIRLCCDCYLNSNTKPKNWFSIPCRHPHQIVLAKQVGWPFWPAKVMKVLPDGYDVRFFGPGHHRARVALSCVKPITSSPRSLKLGASTSKRYEGALLELSIYHKLMPIDSKVELMDVKKEFQSVELMRRNNKIRTSSSTLKRGQSRSWEPSLRRSNPFCRKVLKFSQSHSSTDKRNSLPFRRKQGRLMSNDKNIPSEDKAESPPKWKRSRTPTLDVKPELSPCTSAAVERPRSRKSQKLQVAADITQLDQAVQADLVCAGCYNEFDAMVRALKNQLDLSLHQDLESLQKRMNDEYQVDKQNAVERILSCTQRELDHVRQSIRELHRQQRDDLIRQVDIEHKLQLAALKKKQWCSNCENEAVYYCCWGTCYCSVDCQKEHWETDHKNTCRHKPLSV